MRKITWGTSRHCHYSQEKTRKYGIFLLWVEGKNGQYHHSKRLRNHEIEVSLLGNFVNERNH